MEKHHFQEYTLFFDCFADNFLYFYYKKTRDAS